MNLILTFQKGMITVIRSYYLSLETLPAFQKEKCTLQCIKSLAIDLRWEQKYVCFDNILPVGNLSIVEHSSLPDLLAHQNLSK